MACTAFLRELQSLLAASVVTGAATPRPTVLSLDDGMHQAVTLLVQTRQRGGKVMVVGNGGSAAIAAHLQADLSNAAKLPTLTFDATAQMTALANDHSYAVAFARGIDLWAQPGDMLIAISSSGASANIIAAVEHARQRQCQVLTFSGFAADNALRRLGEVNIYVPANHYGLVECAHGILCHWLSDALLQTGEKCSVLSG